MACLSCGSKKQGEFFAEMLTHFDGLDRKRIKCRRERLTTRYSCKQIDEE
jgi:hypothetical protein